ncbi:MAG: diaminopimelate decarboxylase family protein [Candidatus Hodarchaeota archaeon]
MYEEVDAIALRSLGLKYTDHHLHIGSVSYREIIEEFQTPIFIFLEDRLLDNIASFQAAFPHVEIAYAMKANYLGIVSNIICSQGLGTEIMSLFELKLALDAGFPPHKIIFNGPGKTERTLAKAIQEQIALINIEAISELSDIQRLSEDMGYVQECGVRLQVPMTKKMRQEALIRPGYKLGVDPTTAFKIIEQAQTLANIDLVALHSHIGTRRGLGTDLFPQIVERITEFLETVETKLGIRIRILDLGGGFPSRIHFEMADLSLQTLATTIMEKLSSWSDIELIFEPGRYLVGDSMVCLAQVLRTKKSFGENWAITDIGANTVIPLGYASYSVIPCIKREKKSSINIGGPLCIPSGIIAKNCPYLIKEKDIIAILNVGAYTLSMEEQFGNLRVGVVHLKDSSLQWIHKPETWEDYKRFRGNSNNSS